MFIVLPVGMNYQTQRLPVVTFSLIGINTFIWLVTTIFFFSTKGESDLWIMQHFWLIPSQSVLLTYLTSMFVHAGFFHLVGNMIFLFLFGCCVEDMLGRVRFIVFYLMGGLLAELAYIAFSPMHFASNIPMGGASGAISACMGMYLLLRAGENIEFKYFFWFGYISAGEFEVPAWVAITFWFLKDLFWMVIDMNSNHHGGGVAFGAHVGGLLGGLGLVAIYRWIGTRYEPAEEIEEIIVAPTPKPAPVAVRRVMRLSSVVTETPVVIETPTITETPTIYLHDGVQQTGPFTLTHIQSLLHRNEISPETKYWCEGLDGWQNVTELSDQPSG